MSGASKGKDFEKKFKEDWQKSFSNDSTVIRLYDQMSGFKKVSKNPCDFICYSYPYQYLIECKSHYGNTFPFSEFPQYEEMLKYKDKRNICAGVIVWFIDHDTVVFTPISEVEKMIFENKKSINIKDIKADKYNFVIIPSVKKRVFMDSNYAVLENYMNNREAED